MLLILQVSQLKVIQRGREAEEVRCLRRYGGGMRMDGLLFAIGVTALAWAIALLFHIPFELIALVGCIGCALFTIFTSF